MRHREDAGVTQSAGFPPRTGHDPGCPASAFSTDMVQNEHIRPLALTWIRLPELLVPLFMIVVSP